MAHRFVYKYFTYVKTMYHFRMHTFVIKYEDRIRVMKDSGQCTYRRGEEKYVVREGNTGGFSEYITLNKSE